MASYEGTLEEIRVLLPTFGRRSFFPAAPNGCFPRENLRYDVIVRGSPGPPGLLDEEVPVGLVSKQYSLVQHTDVLDLVRRALTSASIPECQVTAHLEITENGERIALHVVLPDEYGFDPGDGHRMGLRLSCFNSVDGSTKFMAVVGWLRFVCSNGMVIGVARADIRRVHDETLRLQDVGYALNTGMRAAKRDKKRYEQWLSMPLETGTLESWVDGPLREAWGPKAATRAFHISLGGADVEFADRFERADPSRRVVRTGRRVPGMDGAELTVFKVSQALAWLARGRREIPEQLECMEQIPKLMALLGRR